MNNTITLLIENNLEYLKQQGITAEEISRKVLK
jgi:hypothetical protein